MNWIKKSILRKLVVLSVVISLIIFASLGVYVSIRVNTILTENVKEKLVYEADVMSSELNAYFEKNGAVAEQMATDPKVLPFMSSLRTREDKFSHPDFPGFVEEMLAVEATDPNIALSWFGLLKINDLVIDDVTWQHKPDYDMASRPWFLEMKEKGTLTYSTPYIDDITKKLVVSILYPIYDGTEIVGNTAIDLMIDEMSAYISEFKIGDSGYSILITDDGTIVSHPDETKILESNLKDEGGKVAELAGKMISGEQGLDSYVENGKEKYVAYSPIESTGWAVAVVIDRAETIKEVNAFVWSLVLVFFAGVLILVLMIAFVMKKTLKRVPEVKKQIEEFAKGDLSVTIENPGQDEIGQIANSFNEMAGNIKHIVQTVIHSSEQLYNSSEGLVRISDESSKALGEIATTITEDLKRELKKRMQALVDIGLGYLSLSRGVGSLSGGEAQRIKIAKYINSALTDLLYVLDEPSVGLHPHDIALLKNSILKLNKQGNTILIVEHHREIIKMADHIVEMGPNAGSHGGEIVFEGSYEQLLNSSVLTGKLLREIRPLKKNLRSPNGWYSISDASLHNLKNISVSIPKGVLTVVAGVAGSGKSSLMEYFREHTKEPVLFINQKDIGISLRSTPATYLDIADSIRSIFAKENKVSPSLFSFNAKGACPLCKGKGVIVSEMAFMDSIETTCELCNGKRYHQDVLKYLYQGKNIAEVMDLSVEEALLFFKDQHFSTAIQRLSDVGLSYLHLNQALSTLSGGELQRMKLASHLTDENHIIILDEPTDGLHLSDVNKLIQLFQKIVDKGNTLLLIAHSLELMKEADYIIELGPKAGEEGGRIVFRGTPPELLLSDSSVTAPYLLKYI